MTKFLHHRFPTIIVSIAKNITHLEDKNFPVTNSPQAKGVIVSPLSIN